MKSLFIVRIEALTVTDMLGRGNQFGNLFRITNDPKVIAALLPPCFAPICGSLETDYLLLGEPVVYAIEDYSPSNNAEAMSHLNLRLRQVSYFLHLLWYEKDNAACTEMGYLVTGLSEPRPCVYRNWFGGGRSTALGEFHTVPFSREELRRPRRYFDESTPSESVESSQILVEPVGRWGRADYFVQAARASADLGVKLANYCTALEALFATDNQELSHKLSERTAVFLETDFAKRRELYHLMKRAYSGRSKVVHGAGGSAKDLEKVRDAAAICDDACRRALLRILAEKDLHSQFLNDKPDEGIEEFFLNLLFRE